MKMNKKEAGFGPLKVFCAFILHVVQKAKFKLQPNQIRSGSVMN